MGGYMNWAAAFYVATLWLLAAAAWQFFRPIPSDASHRHVAIRVFQDIAPAVLLGLLLARIL
jgi:hypothetical protein